MCRSGRVQSGLPSRVRVQLSNNGRVRVGSFSGPGSKFKAFLGSAQVRIPLSNKIRVRVGSVQHIYRSLQVQIFGHVKTSTSKGTSDAHIPQVGMILKFRVFLKWCQWSCKTTPFVP